MCELTHKGTTYRLYANAELDQATRMGLLTSGWRPTSLSDGHMAGTELVKKFVETKQPVVFSKKA